MPRLARVRAAAGRESSAAMEREHGAAACGSLGRMRDDLSIGAQGPAPGPIEAEERPRRGRWLYALAALPPLVGIATVQLAPEPHGHWVTHLLAVGFKFTQLAVLLTVLALLGWRRLPAPLVVALVVTGAGIAVQVFGDALVASATWRTTGDPHTTGDAGVGSGYASGHDATGLGDLLVVLGSFGFVIAAGIGRRVRVWLAAGAAVLTIVPPPFLWPAAGVLLLLLHAVTSGAGFARRSATRPRAASSG